MANQSFSSTKAGALTPAKPVKQQTGTAKCKPNASQRRAHNRSVARAKQQWETEVKAGQVYGAVAMPIYKTTRVGKKKVTEIVDHLVPSPPPSRIPRLADAPRKPNRNYKSASKPTVSTEKGEEPKKKKRASGAARRKARREEAARRGGVDEFGIPKDLTYKPRIKTPSVVSKAKSYKDALVNGVQGAAKVAVHEHPWVTVTGARYCVVDGCPRFIKPDVLVKYSPTKTRKQQVENKVNLPLKKSAEVKANVLPTISEESETLLDLEIKAVEKRIDEVDAMITRSITGPIKETLYKTKDKEDPSALTLAKTVVRSESQDHSIPLLSTTSSALKAARAVQNQLPQLRVQLPPLSPIVERKADDIWAVVPYDPSAVQQQPVDMRLPAAIARATRNLSPTSANAAEELINSGISLPPYVGQTLSSFDTEQRVPNNYGTEFEDQSEAGISIVTFSSTEQSPEEFNVVYARRSRKGALFYQKGFMGVDRDLYYCAREKRMLVGKGRNDERFLKTQLVNWIAANRASWTSEKRFKQLAMVITATAMPGEFEDMQKGFLKKTDAMTRVKKAHDLNTVGDLGTRRRRFRFWKIKDYKLPTNGGI